jgi:ubiquitin C-terminal hydrolase
VTAGDVLDKYEVKGSIIHVGQYGGHYMSMIKLGKWILQDDTKLTQVDFPETHDHHVLMYTLKTPPS